MWILKRMTKNTFDKFTYRKSRQLFTYFSGTLYQIYRLELILNKFLEICSEHFLGKRCKIFDIYIEHIIMFMPQMQHSSFPTPTLFSTTFYVIHTANTPLKKYHLSFPNVRNSLNFHTEKFWQVYNKIIYKEPQTILDWWYLLTCKIVGWDIWWPFTNVRASACSGVTVQTPSTREIKQWRACIEGPNSCRQFVFAEPTWKKEMKYAN